MAKSIKVRLRGSESDILCEKKQFEELFDLVYLPHLEFAHWEIEQRVKKLCNAASQKKKIEELTLWLGKLHEREIDEALIPDVSVRWVDEEIGYGLFTNKALKKWEFIGEYAGVLRKRALLFPDLNDYSFMYPRKWLRPSFFTIDSEREGNFTRFINHSDQPNLESISVYHKGIFRIIFRAIADIAPGAQLTYDYGDAYWRRRDYKRTLSS